jgi:hypothetical protein
MTARGRTLDLGLAALAAAQLGGAAWLVPDGDRLALADGTPVGGLCLSHALFGLECPFCGMTRSFVALAHGDLAAALRFHPAGPLLFAAMLILVGAVAIAAARRSRPLVERRRFLVALEAVTLGCLTIGVFNMVRS